MKKHTIIIIMYMVLTLLTGCGGRSAGWHTGNVTLVRAVGVDRLPADKVRLSAFGDELLTAEGLSVAEGMRQLTAAGKTFVHFGHADQLLLGEQFVQEGIEPLLDYMARDGQIGPAVSLWVLRGETAERALAAGSDVSERLSRLTQTHSGSTPKVGCSATELMSILARQGSAAIPALTLEQEHLMPAGYAVLRRGRLVGFLNEDQALGFELLRGRGRGQGVEVSVSGAARVALKANRATVSCEPVFVQAGARGLQLRCEVRLEPIQGAVLTAQQRESAVRQAELTLCGRMAAALACAQLWDADFMGLEHRAKAVCSEEEWADMAWQTNFRALPLRVVVGAQVSWPADMVKENGNE